MKSCLIAVTMVPIGFRVCEYPGWYSHVTELYARTLDSDIRGGGLYGLLEPLAHTDDRGVTGIASLWVGGLFSFIEPLCYIRANVR